MSPGRTRVAMIVLDAFPHSVVGPTWSPHLWSLIESGGYAPEGGTAVMTAATYPNHASFVTGVGPETHGIYTNCVVVGDAIHKAQEIGPSAPTLFDRCASAGARSVAAFGDQNLVGVCGAERAAAHWPPKGELAADSPRSRLGYSPDGAVVEALDSLALDDADFTMVQLDEVDTAVHLYGPDSEPALEQYRATDAALGEVLARLRSRWDETIVLAISDHDQEPVTEGAIDLAAAVSELGLDLQVVHEGTAAHLVGNLSEADLRALPGIEGSERLAPGNTVVWGRPGSQFGPDYGLAAQHGSPRTRTQLAAVGGGHATVPVLSARLRAERPPATLWAGLVAEALGLPDASP